MLDIKAEKEHWNHEGRKTLMMIMIMMMMGDGEYDSDCDKSRLIFYKYHKYHNPYTWYQWHQISEWLYASIDCPEQQNSNGYMDTKYVFNAANKVELVKKFYHYEPFKITPSSIKRKYDWSIWFKISSFMMYRTCMLYNVEFWQMRMIFCKVAFALCCIFTV